MSYLFASAVVALSLAVNAVVDFAAETVADVLYDPNPGVTAEPARVPEGGIVDLSPLPPTRSQR